jgi:hypothetical protein
MDHLSAMVENALEKLILLGWGQGPIPRGVPRARRLDCSVLLPARDPSVHARERFWASATRYMVSLTLLF